MTSTAPTAPPTRIPVLSIRQPWAWLILHAGKDIENRTWPTRYRGPLLIHAGRTIDHLAVAMLTGIGVDLPTSLPTGGVMGRVTLLALDHDVDCGCACSPWAEHDQWHWHLANSHALVTPVPCRGRLGLFYPPADIAEHVAAQLEAVT